MMDKNITLQLSGGDAGCLGIGYIMVSDGDESFAIRATTRYTPGGVKKLDHCRFPTIDLGEFGCAFKTAYYRPIETDGFTLKDMAQFLYSQRKRAAELVGAIKFAEIDQHICKTIKECSDRCR